MQEFTSVASSAQVDIDRHLMETKTKTNIPIS